jgi:hypothetical protein
VLRHSCPTALHLARIGLSVSLGTIGIILHAVYMAAVEGQFYASRSEHLQAVALVGGEYLRGEVLVIIFIGHNNGSQYKNTPRGYPEVGVNG